MPMRVFRRGCCRLRCRRGARARRLLPTTPCAGWSAIRRAARPTSCARLIGQYLSEHLGQQFDVENKPGAGNNLATEMAAHSPPDGYTVFLVNPANTINATLYKNLSFDFLRDMAPGRRLHPRAQRDGGQSQRAGAHGRRVHRLRQGQSGQGQYGFVRRRHFGASVGRVVHDDDRRRPRARALSRRGAGADRSAGRPGAGHVRQSAVLDRAYPAAADCARSR